MKYGNSADFHDIFDCVHDSPSKIILLVYFYVNDAPNTKEIKTAYEILHYLITPTPEYWLINN